MHNQSMIHKSDKKINYSGAAGQKISISFYRNLWIFLDFAFVLSAARPKKPDPENKFWPDSDLIRLKISAVQQGQGQFS